MAHVYIFCMYICSCVWLCQVCVERWGGCVGKSQ